MGRSVTGADTARQASGHDIHEQDAALIRRSWHDPEAFAGLFDRYVEQIHHYVARRLGTDAADDIVAETFLAAFRRRHSYDTERAMARPWLYGIATNLVARHRRSEQRYLRVLHRTGMDPLPEPMADAVAARVTAQMDERRMAKALGRLSPDDRDVLLMAAWGGLSYEEMAQALEVPIGTIRSRLHRARKKMQAALGADPTTRIQEV
ncbi:RNA polymerase sigma-70 factor (ECF subfamily) [Actinoallomurus bryophytorum]|uniref:RNA polymerase sigma-70 factor (ECF subfamily) n=1 Tax=Actinoallomurus bryophytorum TaxID=1490222 RepID=A0A543BT96_9ACTN|nr:RNA polymerase sigma-70 factor (ECF subfamily) [Actinoallomurus bryophytorum]